MRKEEVGNILVHLWGCKDQAPLMDMVNEAFRNLPLAKQKDFIDNLLDSPYIIPPDEETIYQACKLLGKHTDEVKVIINEY